MSLHPHGDASIVNALVRLGQPWLMNYPLIYGHGNFGNTDGDKAAASRYIQARISDFAIFTIFDDLDKVSVNYEYNYEYDRKSPEYFPTKIPLVLVNGISGLGEAFTVELPTHNLNDVADICIKYIENKDVSNDELIEGLYPDFPTGGEISNGNDIQEFYRSGKPTSIIVRGKADLIRENNTIVLTEFPFRVDVHDIEDKVLEEIAGGNMILQGITSIQDDNGYNDDEDEDKGFDDKRKNKGRKKTYEYTCKKDANMIEILQELYRRTPFQSSLKMSFIVNEGGKLKYVKIRDIVEDWYRVRVDCKRRKHSNAMAQLYNRKHILEGVLSIYDIMDKVIQTIKENQSNKDGLIRTLHNTYGLTIVQAKGIYEMSLGSLSAFGREDLTNTIQDMNVKILENEKALTHIDEIIINELKETKEKFGRPRRTNVLLSVEEHKLSAVNPTKGAFLLSHSAIGLFDMNGVKDSRNIINGLKPTKIQGKNVRVITGGKPLINKTPIGFIVGYDDGQVNRIHINIFKVINVWYFMNITEPIISGAPIYSEDDILICLSSDRKLKRVLSKDIYGGRKLQTGSPIIEVIGYNEGDKEGYTHLLMIASNGTYHLSEIDDIPLVNRAAGGVKSPYEGYQGQITMLPLPEEILESERLFLGCSDNRDGQNYIVPYNPELLKISGRTSKPKRLQIPEHYQVTSAALIDIADKNSQICMIGKNSTTTLGVGGFRKSFEIKRTFITPLVISLI
jgi:DNA gyrase/topoisomerase IV subunit A